MNTITIVACMTLYLFISLLALWWAVDRLHAHLDRAVNRIREQRNEDLRWHRDSLLADLRLEQTTHKHP